MALVSSAGAYAVGEMRPEVIVNPDDGVMWDRLKNFLSRIWWQPHLTECQIKELTNLIFSFSDMTLRTHLAVHIMRSANLSQFGSNFIRFHRINVHSWSEK